eukprot:231750-Chlamydomonas_euryale.AAC.4
MHGSGGPWPGDNAGGNLGCGCAGGVGRTPVNVGGGYCGCTPGLLGEYCTGGCWLVAGYAGGYGGASSGI